MFKLDSKPTITSPLCCLCTFINTVGVSTREDDGLKFLYENHDEFSVVPSFAVIPALDAVGNLIMSGNIGGIEAHPAMVILRFSLQLSNCV